MKYLLFVAFFALPLPRLLSQLESNDHSDYEREILLNKDATHLELLMAIGSGASKERTLAVKQELDAFISEVKSSGIMRLSKVKLMKELHRKVHSRFLNRYQYVCPFPQIFESGKYNCVSATALFALILEELNIPYSKLK
ncbi:hypothetical protein D3C71_1179920 [compost metagenome]